MKKLLTVILFAFFVIEISAQNPYINVDSLELAIKETNSDEGCLKHKNTVRNAAVFYLNTPAPSKKWDDPVVQFKRSTSLRLVMQWAEHTSEVVLSLDNDMLKGILVGGNKGYELTSAYIAATVVYVIENHVDKITKDAYIYAMEETLRYYTQNKKVIGKSNPLEKLLVLSEEKRAQELAERYKNDL